MECACGYSIQGSEKFCPECGVSIAPAEKRSRRAKSSRFAFDAAALNAAPVQHAALPVRTVSDRPDELKRRFDGIGADRETDAAWIAETCALCNSLFDTIPHHGLKEICVPERVFYASDYQLFRRVSAVFSELRMVERRLVPKTFKAVTVPEDRRIDEDTFDHWSFKVEEPPLFVGRRAEYPIPESFAVEECDSCNGARNITCNSCNGAGRSTCYGCGGAGSEQCWSCHGSGRTSCSSCGGSGRSTCGSCGGTGREFSTGDHAPVCGSCRGSGSTQCWSCNGSGSDRCYSCGGDGRNTCTICSGNGMLVCGSCHGKGKVTCDTCEGTGSMVNMLVLISIFYTSTMDADAFSMQTRIPTALCHYHEEEESIADAPYELVAEMADTIIPESLFDGVEDSGLKDSLCVFAEFLQNLAREDKDNHILAVDLKVYAAPVRQLTFQYNNDAYTVAVYNGRLFSDADPVSEMAQRWSAMAQEFLNSKAYGSAYAYADRIHAMYPLNKDYYDSRRSAAHNFRRDCFVSSVIGSVAALTGILLVPAGEAASALPLIVAVQCATMIPALWSVARPMTMLDSVWRRRLAPGIMALVGVPLVYVIARLLAG